MISHDYLSTACLHKDCSGCRLTCKFCDAPCLHGCHRGGRALPQPWVDQSRAVGLELLAALGDNVPPELARRISEDPDLFWLRGEIQPDGVWHEPERR